MSGQRKYRDYSLGARIRLQIGNILSPYARKDQVFGSEQLRNVLVEVFKFKQYEVSYQLLKILFFGKNKYQSVKLDELINYIAEKHMGQNTINKYSLKYNYLCNNDKLMTKSQFVNTINMALLFIVDRQIEKDESTLNEVFEEIDTNKSGTISQGQYLSFLKEYFGSQSPMAANNYKKDDSQIKEELLYSKSFDQPLSPHKLFGDQLFESKQILSPARLSRSKSSNALDQFKDLINGQIIAKCSEFDVDNKGYLTRSQTYNFFYDIVGLEGHSIEFILANYFDFVSLQEVGMAQLAEVISQVHFRQIFSTLLKQELKIDAPNKCLLDGELFKRKMLENCYFFNVKPSQKLLENVFYELQRRSDLKQSGFITLEDLRSYVLTFLCNNRLIFRKNPSKKTNTMLMSVPLSIAQVQNSHFEQDSECNQMRARQFSSSLCEPYDEEKILNGKGETNQITSSHIGSRKDIRFGFEEERKELTSQKMLRQTSKINQEYKEQTDNELTFSNLPRKRNSQLPQQRTSVKQKFYLNLRKILLLYSQNNNEYLSYNQCQSLFNKQPSLNLVDPSAKQKVLSYVKKHTQINQYMLIHYLIKALGEFSLKVFNKSSIKGKFLLEEKQIVDMIFGAYGTVGQLNLENVRTLVAKFIMKNPGKQLNYKTYLQIINQEMIGQPK